MLVGEMLGSEYKPVNRRWVSSGDVMHSIVMIVNNTALYTSKWLREKSQMSSPQKTIV